MCHTRVALLKPRPSAGVSSLVAPVTLVGLDPVARENLARVEGDEGDLLLIDDGKNSTPGLEDAGVEVMKPATAPQGYGALAVGDVIAEAEVASAGVRWHRLRCRPIRFARCPPTNRSMGPLLVIGSPEGVELGLEFCKVDRRRPLAEPAFEGLVEALDLALGLRVGRRSVLLTDAEVGEEILEVVAAAGEARGVDRAVVGERGFGPAVASG